MSEQEKYLITPLEDIMSDRFGRYAKYIIQDRALPDARDGLKPVQRRILYAMYEDGNTHDKSYRKSVKSIGLVIGNYHPHGESSVYDAMTRMSQYWKMRECLIDMHGNNGSMDDDPAAAMRYTEARLSAIAESLLVDIEKDTVLFAPNFDDTALEPTVLPASYPNLIVNGTTGIAAGYATNIPPHNLQEVIEATIFRVYNPYCSLEDIMDIIKGPDLPTGGIVQGIKGIADAFRTGKGRIIIRAKTEFVETRTINQIVITEIPYEVIKSNLVRKMDEIRANKDIDGVLAVRDESDRNGLRIVVDLRKEVNQELVLNYFLKNTDLQVYYNYNVIAIVNKRPMQMGIINMLDAYIEHREEVIIRRSRHELNKMEQRCHILEGLIKAVSILDEIIQVIRASTDKTDAKARLVKKFSFSDAQAEAIVTLRLYRLTNTDIKELREEFAQLVNQMQFLRSLLEDRKALHAQLVKELQAIMEKFATPRRTLIEEEMREIIIDKVQMITSERVVVTCSRDGYVKRVSMRSYNASENAPCGVKDGDAVLCWKEVDTLDTLLVFTSKGRFAYVPVYTLEESKWKEVGAHLSGVAKISGDEKIIDVVVLQDFETQAYAVIVTKNGLLKRTLIPEFAVQRYSKAIACINMKEDDCIAAVRIAYDFEEVVLLSKDGFVVRYGLASIPLQSLKSGGVKAMQLSSEDSIVGMDVFDGEKTMLCAMTNKGAMKRMRLDQIALCNRPARGEMIVKRKKTNPLMMDDIRLGTVNESIQYLRQKALQTLLWKDIPLMDKTATVSAVIEEDVMIQKTMQAVKVVARKEDAISVKDNEQMRLELEDSQ